MTLVSQRSRFEETVDMSYSDDTPDSQPIKATAGPWQMLDSEHPSMAGINFDTLRQWIADRRVTARSVVRGPTTAQMWKPAAKVKGLSREFGICYNCEARVNPTASVCPHCNRSQTLPFDPDTLLDSDNSPAPMPASDRPISNQPWTEEPPLRHSEVNRAGTTAAPVPPRRKVFRRDLLLTPSELAKVFQLEAGPAAKIDYTPRRNRKRALRRVGVRATIVMLLAGTTLVAVHESLAAGPLAWQWVRQTLLSTAPVTSAAAVVATTPPPVMVAIAPIHVATPSPQSVTVAPAATPHAAPPAKHASAPQLAADAVPADIAPDKIVGNLWNAGLAAESQRKFAKAASLYEQILSYPDTYWPHTISLRLKLARQESTSGGN